MTNSTVIDSQLKKLNPPTIDVCSLVDCINLKTYFEIFDKCLQNQQDDNIEQLAHLISVALQLHAAAIKEAVFPLAKKVMSKTAVNKLSTQLEELENTVESIDATKKHLKNEEFVDLMKKLSESFEMFFKSEQQTMAALAKDVEEETLMKAADQAEEAKAGVTLVA